MKLYVVAFQDSQLGLTKFLKDLACKYLCQHHLQSKFPKEKLWKTCSRYCVDLKIHRVEVLATVAHPVICEVSRLVERCRHQKLDCRSHRAGSRDNFRALRVTEASHS